MRLLILLVSIVSFTQAMAQDNSMLLRSNAPNLNPAHIFGTLDDQEQISSGLAQYGLTETMEQLTRLRDQILADPDNSEYFELRNTIENICHPYRVGNYEKPGTYLLIDFYIDEDGSQEFQARLFTQGYYDNNLASGISHKAEVLIAVFMTRESEDQNWKRNNIQEILEIVPVNYLAQDMAGIYITNQSDEEILALTKLNVAKLALNGAKDETRECQSRIYWYDLGYPDGISPAVLRSAKNSCEDARGKLRSVYGEVRETYNDMLGSSRERIEEIENPNSFFLRNSLGQNYSRRVNASELSQLNSFVQQLTTNMRSEIRQHRLIPHCDRENPEAVNTTAQMMKDSTARLIEIQNQINSSAQGIEN